jgi:hypothetical protein
MEYAHTSLNKRLALTALIGRFGFRKTPVGLSALCGILLHHIFAALDLLRKPLFGLQKRRQPRTLNDSSAEFMF